MSDWAASDDETVATPAAVTVKPPLKKANKWEGEDDENDGPVVSFLPNHTIYTLSFPRCSLTHLSGTL